MKSPDLDPELVASLLESLASWDPRASVPLALTYMRVGDEAALQGFDAMALSNPAASGMLESRYLSPTPDVAFLASLPEGVDAILVTDVTNVSYLTGFTGDSSWLIDSFLIALINDSKLSQ